MYQEELFANAVTDAKKADYGNLSGEVKGLEAKLERFFTKIFESSAFLAERDCNMNLD